MLGIELGKDVHTCNKLNIESKVNKLSTKLNMWSQRSLTLVGKILISKAFGISNLVYSLSCVTSKNDDIKQAQQVVNNFIWSQGTAKIKHTTLIGNYDSAGLNAPDLMTMRKTLRLAWIGRLWEKKKSNGVINIDLDRYGGIKLILHSNYDTQQMYLPEFYKELLVYYKELQDLEKYGGILWNNKNFVIGGQSLFIKEWYEKGILYVKDLLDNTSNLLSKEELQEKYNLNTIEILLYNALKIKLAKWLKLDVNTKFLSNAYKIDTTSSIIRIGNSVINVKQAKSRDYYNILVNKIYEKPSSIKHWVKWGLQDENRILESLELYRTVTKETYLITMQAKIIHNAIATNKKKKDWKISVSDKCKYCNEEENVYHYFWECIFSQSVIQQCWNILKLNHLHLEKWDFLFGKNDIGIDNVSILIKYYIYTLRKQNKSYDQNEFVHEVHLRKLTDLRSMNKARYADKWALVGDTVQGYGKE